MVPAIVKYVLKKNCPLVVLFQKDMAQDRLEKVVLDLVRTPSEVRAVRAIISALRRWTREIEDQNEYQDRPDDRGSDCTGAASDPEVEADPEAEADVAGSEAASSGGSVYEVAAEKETETGTSGGSSKRHVSNQAVKARSTKIRNYLLEQGNYLIENLRGTKGNTNTMPVMVARLLREVRAQGADNLIAMTCTLLWWPLFIAVSTRLGSFTTSLSRREAVSFRNFSISWIPGFPISGPVVTPMEILYSCMQNTATEEENDPNAKKGMKRKTVSLVPTQEKRGKVDMAAEPRITAGVENPSIPSSSDVRAAFASMLPQFRIPEDAVLQAIADLIGKGSATAASTQISLPQSQVSAGQRGSATMSTSSTTATIPPATVTVPSAARSNTDCLSLTGITALSNQRRCTTSGGSGTFYNIYLSPANEPCVGVSLEASTTTWTQPPDNLIELTLYPSYENILRGSKHTSGRDFWRNRLWKIRIPLWLEGRNCYPELARAVQVLFNWACHNIMDHPSKLVQTLLLKLDKYYKSHGYFGPSLVYRNVFSNDEETFGPIKILDMIP